MQIEAAPIVNDGSGGTHGKQSVVKHRCQGASGEEEVEEDHMIEAASLEDGCQAQ